MPVQLGGGIRDMRTIDGWLGKGVARVIIGTAAVRDPGLVREAARRHPGKIAVGVDARDGLVAVEGWAKSSQLTAVELGKRFEDAGVAAIIYTDIARDGVLKGLNIEATLALANSSGHSGDRVRAGWPRSPTSSGCWSPIARVSPAPSPAARFMTAGSILEQALNLIKSKRAA